MKPVIEIDLGTLLNSLVEQFRTTLSTFTEENPDTQICTVGLYGDGFHGNIGLCLDTPGHSAAHVAEWEPKGGSIGGDEADRFCSNCADFEFWVTDYFFAGFPDIYQVHLTSVLQVTGIDGVVTNIDLDDTHDEELHIRIAEPLMRAAAAALMPFNDLNKAARFRVLLQFQAFDALDVLTPPSESPGN